MRVITRKLFEKLDRGTLNGMDTVIKTAEDTRTKIIVEKDGKIKYISIMEAKRRLRNAKTI